MRKTGLVKILAALAVTVLLMAMPVYAAVDNMDENTAPINTETDELDRDTHENADNEANEARRDEAGGNEINDRNTAGTHEAVPIKEENPDTGVSDVILPGFVALLSAAAAAVAIAGRKNKK